MILKLMKRYEKIQQWANNGHFKYQRKKQNPQTQSTKGFAGNVTGDPYGNRIEQMPFCKLSKSASNGVNKPNYNKI